MSMCETLALQTKPAATSRTTDGVSCATTSALLTRRAADAKLSLAGVEVR